jgi:hypothetical protein
MKQTLKNWQEKHPQYYAASQKAVDFQLQYLQADGGYIWDGYARDAFHKQAYSWQLAGRIEEAHRLLTWIRDNKLQSDGQLVDYNGDLYKHAWLFTGAHRLGRFDVSYPVLSFLLANKAPCGGFPFFAGEDKIRSMASNMAGLSAVYFGNLALAKEIGECMISLLRQQPDPDKFYFYMTNDGTLITDDENCVDTTKEKQCYWEVGFCMLLMCRLYQATGAKSYLDRAKEFFDFNVRCADDKFSYWGSGKTALAAALYYTYTGDERCLEAAYGFCDFVLETQKPEGGFQYEDEPDELLYYVDHAACFSVWVPEVLATLATCL